MKQRFLDSIKDIPEIDRADILAESPIFKPNAVKVHQQNPEFT